MPDFLPHFIDISIAYDGPALGGLGGPGWEVLGGVGGSL